MSHVDKRCRTVKALFVLCGLISHFGTAVPAHALPEISGRQQQSFVDNNADNRINPGEEVEYVISVTNPTAEDLANLTLASFLDPNVTISSAAKIVSSGAFDDCYGTSLNAAITKTASDGLLSNDLSGFTIIPATSTSDRGVSVSINADGSFTYTPPANFSGTDTFSYSAVGSDGETNVGKVSITILSALSGTQVTELQTILGASGTSTIVSTLRADLNSIGASLSGASSTPTTADLKSAIATLQSAVDGTTTGSLSSKLSTVSNLVIASGSKTNLLADLNASLSNLGGSGTLGSRISSLAAKLLVTPSGNLTSDIGTLQALLTSTPAASIQADVRAINSALDGAATGSTTQARVATLVAAVDNGAANLQSAVNGVSNSLGNSGDLADRVGALISLVKSGAASLNAAISDVATSLGGSGTLAQRVSAVINTLLVTPSSSLNADLSTLRGLLVSSPAATAEADVRTIATKLNGTATGGTLEGRIGSPTINSVASNISAVIGTSSATLAEKIGDPGADYVNISDYLSSESSTDPIVTQIQNIMTRLMGTTTSGISISTAVGNPQRPVPSGHPSFPLQDTNIGTLLGTGFNLAVGIGTPPSYLAPSISSMLGGTGSTLVSRIQGILNRILVTPTEVVRNDIATLSSLIVDNSTVSLESDIREINFLLNGDATTGTLQSRIGAPSVNGSSSSLSSVLGGSESNLADRLGDPLLGSSGLSALIKGGTASCGALDCTNFNNATDLNTQIAAFISTMNNGGTLPPGSYNSLADILAAMQ